MYLKIITILCSILLLSACANEPEKITLTPNLVNKPQIVYAQQQAKVNVIDVRAKEHIVELISADDPSVFIETSTPIKTVLAQKFTHELINQGLQVVDSSDVKVDFLIKKARTYVNQDVLDYRANTIIKLLVKVENPEQTLSKTFTLRATSRGPFTADLEELQKGFNVQLSKLILQVLEDDQLQAFIKG